MDLSLGDFEDKVGEHYDIVATDGVLPLVLERIEPLPRTMRDAGAFRLEWRGPGEPILPQATYAFRRGDEAFEMFIVPVGRDSTGTLYEAIFN